LVIRRVQYVNDRLDVLKFHRLRARLLLRHMVHAEELVVPEQDSFHVWIRDRLWKNASYLRGKMRLSVPSVAPGAAFAAGGMRPVTRAAVESWSIIARTSSVRTADAKELVFPARPSLMPCRK